MLDLERFCTNLHMHHKFVYQFTTTCKLLYQFAHAVQVLV
jgi:hypothetical protein